MEVLIEVLLYIISIPLEGLIHIGFDTFHWKANRLNRIRILQHLKSKKYDYFLFETNGVEIILYDKNFILIKFELRKNKKKYTNIEIVSDDNLNFPIKGFQFCKFAKPVYFRIKQSQKNRADIFLQYPNSEFKKEISFVSLSELEMNQLKLIFEKISKNMLE